jgi:uncharacterized protein involved in response to NO
MRPLPLLGYGFRPFFLAAGVAAISLIPWWVGSLTLGVPLPAAWPASLWHAHEMLFGFIEAALAGFMLTAVPSWTGQRGFAGWPLALLAGVWLLGRLFVATANQWPLAVYAAADLAFLPALAAFLMPPLIRSRNRNTRLLLVLTALWMVNATFYWALAHADPGLARGALLAGVNLVLLLVTIIGGRIVPAFTSAALRQQGRDATLHTWWVLDAAAVTAMLAVLLVDIFLPQGRVAGGVALVAAVAQGVRLSQWHSSRTLRLPIVWILHLAYAWLPIGLALKAMALLTGWGTGLSWMHALTIGAAATMIFAVMTRASLGHTGRPLIVRPTVVLAYALLTAATLVRVLGPGTSLLSYPQVITLAAILWTGAFALFLFVYAPILLRPRADGKPG